LLDFYLMTEQRDVRILVICLCVEKLFAYAKLVVRREKLCVQYRVSPFDLEVYSNIF